MGTFFRNRVCSWLKTLPRIQGEFNSVRPKKVSTAPSLQATAADNREGSEPEGTGLNPGWIS